MVENQDEPEDTCQPAQYNFGNNGHLQENSVVHGVQENEGRVGDGHEAARQNRFGQVDEPVVETKHEAAGSEEQQVIPEAKAELSARDEAEDEENHHRQSKAVENRDHRIHHPELKRDGEPSGTPDERAEKK